MWPGRTFCIPVLNGAAIHDSRVLSKRALDYHKLVNRVSVLFEQYSRHDKFLYF